MKKVAGYVRVSTPIQAEEGESLKSQEKAIEDYTSNKGWELKKIYADRGISGAMVDKRQSFMNMMEYANKKQFDVVICTRISRIARNVRDFLNFFHKLEKNGITLISIKENLDPTTYQGKLFMNIIAAIAEFEREVINEQMSENKMIRWRENRIINGSLPFGFCWDKDRRVIKINQKEAKIYKKIVDMYINSSMSMRDIALQLKKEGIKGKRSFFSPVSLSYMLRNSAYYGNYVVNQYKYAGNKRTRDKKPTEEWIPFNIKAIITKEKWVRIQERLEFNKIKSKRCDLTKDYWLRDSLKCGECGGRIKPQHGSTRKDGSFLRYYSCYWATTSPKVLALSNKTKCKMTLIKADEIEEYVWNNFLTKINLRKRSYLRPLLEKDNFNKSLKELETQKSPLEKSLSKKIKAKERIFELFEDSQINKDDLRLRLQQHEEACSELTTRISELNMEINQLNDMKKAAQRMKKLLNGKDKILSHMVFQLAWLEPEDKKRFIETVTPNGLTVDLGYDEYQKKLDWALFTYFPIDNVENILIQLMDEEKLIKLGKNALDHLRKAWNSK